VLAHRLFGCRNVARGDRRVDRFMRRPCAPAHVFGEVVVDAIDTDIEQRRQEVDQDGVL